MDPDSGADTQRTLSLQWKSYKLVQDPGLRRVTQKIYRYDGIHFSVPDSGFPPVGDLRDPRPRRIWSRHTELSLPVPKFKLDEYYVGPVPLKEVTFARLNDNIKEPFLAEMCAKFGEVEEMEILFHPKTRKHLGLARVLFTSTRGAKDTVKHLHNTSVMGNIVHVQLDIKGQQRMKYYNLIVGGSYTPQTVPTGGRALTEKFQPPAPTQPDTSSDIRRRLSTDQIAVPAAAPLISGSTTPCSVDTGFGDQRLDTPPSSLGGPYTPGSSASSQGGGTPYTPRSGTPFSQDSGYSVGRHGGYSGASLSSNYPAVDMLPSSSCSSSAVSSSSGFKPPRYDELHAPPPQEPSMFQRGRLGYPPSAPFRPNEPPYPNVGGSGIPMPLHSPMPPPPGPQYEPPLSDRERDRERGHRDRDRDRDSAGRYGLSSRRSSYHYQQDTNSSSSPSKSYHSHHSHHTERREDRDGRGYRRDSSGSRSGDHGRHRNHHHNHHSSGGGGSNRRRSSRDRDWDRDREGDFSNISDPRYGGHSNSSHHSSNSLSPPPATTSYGGLLSSKDLSPYETPSSSRLEPSPAFRPQQGAGERGFGLGGSMDNDYRTHSHHTPLAPPPPPLPPASVIAAAVAETLSSLDFGQESPVREEQWTKLKRHPSTPPLPPCTPPTSSPPHASIPSSSTSPSSTSLPHQLPSSTASLSSPPPQRDSSPEPDSTNESLPFMHHSSSLDSRIEMLLKEQKSKFSFLASDDEEDEKEEKERGKIDKNTEGRENRLRGEAGERSRHKRQGETDCGQQRRRGEREKDGRRSRGNRQGGRGGEGRKTPPEVASSTPGTHGLVSDSLQGQIPPSQDEHTVSDPHKVAHTPPTYNGERQPSPHSSGEDMEISDEDDNTITTAMAHHAASSSSPATSTQSALPSQIPDPSASPPPDSNQHFSTTIPPPPIPSYPPHLPPPPLPGFSLQPPPPPGIPPPLPHMELHPEYPPPLPHHMYDYASSVELMSQYCGGAPMSFQMQTHMLSRLYQMRIASANSTTAPSGEVPPTSEYPPSYHLHSISPLNHPHHPYLDQDGTVSTHFDQDHRYIPPHLTYPYPDPHAAHLPPPHHHAIPPPQSPWPHHLQPQQYPSHYPPPGFGTVPAMDGELYGAAGDQMAMMGHNPYEAVVQQVLAALIEEMKNIMQRDLNRKIVENVAFGTFDEWWDRKEQKAKPFQTSMRSVSVVREEEKKDEKMSNRPREPLMSLVDWAKSGGMEGFSLRGALRLPSFKVKRKEPQELVDGDDLKRARPSTPPDEEDEDSYQGKSADSASGRTEERRTADRQAARRRNRAKPRKPYDLDSEGEETSDGSSSEKEDEDDSDKVESEDEALSADSDDESISSSSSESSSSSSLSSSSEDDDEGEQGAESASLDTMDESTMDSVAMDADKDERDKASLDQSSVTTTEVKAEEESTAAVVTPSSPYPRPSSPILLLPPLKKRRKTVSFSMEENEVKPSILPSTASSPSPTPASQAPDHPISASPGSTPTAAAPHVASKPLPMLLPFASRPSEGNALASPASPSTVLTVPPPVRSLHPDEPKKTAAAPPAPQTSSPKNSSKRGVGKDWSRTPAAPVCLTVQNLPLDHSSLVKMAYEDPIPVLFMQKGRQRGRPRTLSQSSLLQPALREEDEDDDDDNDEELEQRLKLREQLGVSSLLQLASASKPDLSVLADIALKMDPEIDIDSEETETSDEAEEHKLEEEGDFSPHPCQPLLDPEGLFVLQEHNYSKTPAPPLLTSPQKRTKQDPTVLLPADLNQHGVQEAPEEVIEEAHANRGEHADVYKDLSLLCKSEVVTETQTKTLGPTHKRKGSVRGVEMEERGKGKSKKRSRKDKENEELQTKKQREKQIRKRKLEEFEEDVDVEQLESGELSSSDSGDSEFGLDRSMDFEKEEVRKSERLFLQEAGVTPSTQRQPKHATAHTPVPALCHTYKNRSEFEQMTILYDIWNTGLDQEDMRLLMCTYEKLLQDDRGTDWLNDTHWVPHTITNIPNPRRKKKAASGQLREHVTGCARSEGYYAISRKEKDVYLELDQPVTVQEVGDYDTAGSNRLLSERRSEQRRLLSAIGTSAVMDSDLLKLNQLKFRKKKLRFGRSRIHEWGLFAMEPIAADEMVIEYVGQNIRQMVADNREKRYAQEGIGSSYLFRVDHDTIIDATKCGNLARFINHCCTPNCYAKVITIESQKKIVIYSKQPIGVNEEITYDYKFPIEENKIPCLCGTENCRGTLN
ncbi:histone-lysine N-methyltransferase SETD1A isoform X1 [Xyrauchen texanus]|uniref:histone-lysine N-methyltransferase SETD1A isoform X1 n=1 Tax=Xyrauchen texanus TaxID=154827 RepID=UPI00224245F5|nr:histone-lysine N-methyltransferase SETD1A isoform X1 [Xyrauchen texanus]XP_051988258.1 histone-lysine N-methyltransferase SETD1A isoform X1 [Xyrauchen texanus]